MRAGKKIVSHCSLIAAVTVVGFWLFWRSGMFYSGPIVRDTPLMREYNRIYALCRKLVLTTNSPPTGTDSKNIEAFVGAGILSADDATYVREHNIQFHGFDPAKAEAEVAVFETAKGKWGHILTLNN